MIRASDVEFHPAPAEHQETWAETNYFPFAIPHLNLAGCVYTVFRPGLGVCMSDVTIFDRVAQHWEGLAYVDNQQHIPCPPSLARYTLRNGVSVEATDAPNDYHLRYLGIDDTSLDLRYRGLMRPQDLNDPEQDPLTRLKGSGSGAWDQAFNGHFDQTAHVTGELVLRGTRHRVDCLATIDHSWGPRLERDGGGAVVVQAYFEDDFALHALCGFDPRREAAIGPLLHGYVLRDGAVCGLVEGSGSVKRSGVFPAAIVAQFKAEDGRSYALEGSMKNWAPWAPYPSVIYYSGLAEWRMDGRIGNGPYQEILSRAFVTRHQFSR